ncbi:MAG: adenylosuccinate lyase, partial [Pseudomonadales bacterium]|nr:adenylosuccinate lyase [Pseudomonadales bacterium]
MTSLPLTELTAITAIDGRYRNKCSELAPYFSEYALIRYRVEVEVRWLQHLAGDARLPETGGLDESGRRFLDRLVEDFSLPDAQRVKDIEATT